MWREEEARAWCACVCYEGTNFGSHFGEIFVFARLHLNLVLYCTMQAADESRHWCVPGVSFGAQDTGYAVLTRPWGCMFLRWI